MSLTLSKSLDAIGFHEHALLSLMRDVCISDPDTASGIFNITIVNAKALAGLTPQSLSIVKNIKTPLFHIKENKHQRSILNNIIEALHSDDIAKLNIAVGGGV